MPRREHHRTLRSILPDDSVVVFFMFLAQTLAITALTLIVERVASELSTIVIAAAGVVFLLATAGTFMWREQVRKRGTVVAIIVRRSLENWASVKAAAGEFQAHERFRYWYPLVDSRRPAVPSPGDRLAVANWSSHLESCRGMLSVIFDAAHGAPVDLSRIALMVNAPLPLAFKLGALWTETVPEADEFELVQLSFPDSGVSQSPTVVWHSRPATRNTTHRATGSATVVVRTTPRFHESWLRQFDDVVIIDSPMVIDETSQKDIDRLIEEVRTAVLGFDRVVMVFATTAPVAFALGYWLADLQHRIDLVEYANGVGYVPVSFENSSDATGELTR